jgi:hypothetical protein
LSISKEDLNELNVKFGSKENSNKMFCAGLLSDQRHNCGSRLITEHQQFEQSVILKNPDFPLIYTGFEYAFGKRADSIVRAEKSYRVIAVISKFLSAPRHIYTYVVQDILTGVYDIIEIRHYESYSETHGYIKPQSQADLKIPGSIIAEGEILCKAPSIDENGNYCMGVRAKIAYISLPEVEEDGYYLSEDFAKKTIFYQVEESSLLVNNNTILLNYYGNNGEYKCFPDIGEDIKDGIVAVKRQINFAYASSELTDDALSRIYDGDKSVPGEGKVIDIDVFVNNEEELYNNPNRNQIMQYWIASKYYHQEIVNTLGKIVKNSEDTYSYKLRLLYERSQDFLNPNIKFNGNNGTFEFALINIVTCFETSLYDGYKLTDRHGAKGVTCHIMPTEYMPLDVWGNRADIVQLPPSTIARANIAQNYEQELSFIADNRRRAMASIANEGLDKQFAILRDFIEIIDKEQASALSITWAAMSHYEKAEFISDNILNGIYIRQAPFEGNITLLKMETLYLKYNVHPSRIRIIREFKKHGDRSLLPSTLLDDSYYNPLFKHILSNETRDGKALLTPYTAEFDKLSSIDDPDFTFKDQLYIPGPNGQSVLIGRNKKGEYTNVFPIDTRTPYEIAVDSWSDETIIKDEGGKMIRSFLSERPVIIAEKYFLILKHMPTGKLSARSVGSVSPLGLPNKTSKTESGGPIGTTPIKCVTGDTTILIKDRGFVPIEEVVNTTVTLWNGFEWSDVLIQETGQNQEIYRVELYNGSHIDCNAEHNWYIKKVFGYNIPQAEEAELNKLQVQKIKTSYLRHGMTLAPFNYPIMRNNEDNLLDHAYERGVWSGDGHFASRTFMPEMWIYKNKVGLLPYLTDYITIKEYNEEEAAKLGKKARGQITFKTIARSSKIPFSKNFVPIDYNIDSKLAWLAGIIDTDGNKDNSDGIKQRTTYRISSIKKEFLFNIQRMLWTMGCYSNIRQQSHERDKFMPDGHGSEDLYHCKDGFELYISSFASQTLIDLGINKYLHRCVMIKDESAIEDARNFIRIKSITKLNTIAQKVYCGTEHKKHSIMFNGIVTAQSGEMELFDMLIRMDMKTVHRYLSSVSKNPALRSELFRTLLFEDPLELHDVVIENKDIDIGSDIQAKVFAAYLFALGFEIIDSPEADIYAPFDDLGLSCDELLKVTSNYARLNPIDSFK